MTEEPWAEAERHEQARQLDDALAAELAATTASGESLRARVAAAGYGAFAWRTIDDDLLFAELSFDSALESTGSTRADRADGQRSEGRSLVFTASPQSVEVEVLSDRMVGQFMPPAAGTVVVESETGRSEPVVVDELGFFIIEPVPQGRVRLRCETATTRIVSTWVSL